jgi:hypothetical protein
MPPRVVREPNLPAPYDASVRELVKMLDEAHYNLTGERDPRTASAPWAEPDELFAILFDLARAVSAQALAFRNGARVREGSEPVGWRGSARAGADERMIAKFSAGDATKEAAARDALRAYDDLRGRGMFGSAVPSREAYLRAALADGPRLAGGDR